MKNETEQIIELVGKQTKILLNNHWPDISDFRNGEESIKIGFGALIQYEGQERIVETTISFGKRVKDSTIERINTEQLNLGLSAAPVEPAKPAKRGPGRPRTKNILQTALTSAPSPDSKPEVA